jgi:ferric-dicitrate binding protein FerR (iron transport regulator)
MPRPGEPGRRSPRDPPDRGAAQTTASARLTRRLSNALLAVVAVGAMLIGTGWLSREDSGADLLGLAGERR